MSALPEHVSPQDELIKKIEDAIIEKACAEAEIEDGCWVEGYSSDFAKAAYEVVKEWMK